MSKPASESTPQPSRRTVIGGLTAAGLAAPLLAACGASSGSDGSSSSSSSNSSNSSSTGEQAGATVVAATDVPVGGAALVSSAGLIVTQVKAGTFECFSSTCTHQGCTVNGTLQSGNIVCGCHGSEFNAATGQVVQGPASVPLPKVAVKVVAGNVVRA